MKNLTDNLIELSENELREINGGSERKDSKRESIWSIVHRYIFQ